MAYRVLIVDDSPAMRALVRRVIRVSGFELSTCFEASNGREALDVLRHEWVDAILTDINMPEVDGEELLCRLSGDDLLRSIPVIVISTDATENRISRLLSLGARGYVTKPFLPEGLRAKLENVLGVTLPEIVLRAALQESVDEVLEKMFFIRTLGVASNAADEPEFAAHLTFEGEPSGWLALYVTVSAARSVAADFLGEDDGDLSEQQIGEVICELANMICGSVLSRVESTATFRLAAPQLVSPGSPRARSLPAGSGASSATHCAAMENGCLRVVLQTEKRAWSPTERSAF